MYHWLGNFYQRESRSGILRFLRFVNCCLGWLRFSLYFGKENENFDQYIKKRKMIFRARFAMQNSAVLTSHQVVITRIFV